MKKIIAWLLVLALTAAISIGATLAYLTDTDEDVNVMTVGKVKIDQLEYERVNDETKDADALVQEFHDNKPLYPGVYEDGYDFGIGDAKVDWTQIGKDDYSTGIWDPAKINNELDKMVFVKNKGTYDAYVRTVFAFEAGNFESASEFLKMVHLNLNETNWTWEWNEEPVEIPNAEGTTTKYFIATATYNKRLEPGALTEISLSQIALDKSATNADVEAFGETYQILVKTQAIQADGFDGPAAALNEGFGEIIANVGTEDAPRLEVVEENIPWETDVATKGISLKTALRNYEGDTSNSIVKKVTNVIFGLNEKHEDIISEYDGTLVDVEQDVPVYAYYVPNGSYYDVYFLADDTIYAPANSQGLFADMSRLKTVDTANFDVSRMTNMRSIFDYCSSLETVDTSSWDTGNVTRMEYAFYGCSKLTALDVSGWDVGNVTTMDQTFYGCKKLTELDVSNWDMSNVDFLYGTFYQCSGLTKLDTSNWDTGKVTNMASLFSGCSGLTSFSAPNWNVTSVTTMKDMFRSCGKLATVDIAGWNPCNVTNMTQMFLSCSSLTEVDMANWDVSSVQQFNGMFTYASKLQTVKMDNWQPTSAKSLLSMFHDCVNLQSADVSGWQMPNLLTSSHMFRGCTSATFIDVSDWYTPELTSMDAMFHTCKSLTTVDLSSFDTSKCLEMSQIFDYATGIQYVQGLEKLNTSNARTFEETFAGCSSLKVLDLSNFDTGMVENAYYPMQNNSTGHGFRNMFPKTMNSLEKLILGEKFSFDGNGKVTDEINKVALPSPAAKEGFIAKWQNVETGETYLASEIPEKIAATYVAYYEPITNS